MGFIVQLAASPTTYLVLATGVLFAGLGLIFVKWGKPDRFVSKSLFRAVVSDFGPLAACFGLAVACTLLVWMAFYVRTNSGVPIANSILPSFFTALFEDLLFFATIGIIVFVVQRREFERSRNLDDRVDTLFNGKKLSSEELSYLKREVRKIGCDYQRNEASIDIREYDPITQCVVIDVKRSWRVSSYLRDESVEYDWKLQLTPDDLITASPLMQIFPSQMVRPSTTGSGPDTIELHQTVVLNTPEPYIFDRPAERIEPGTFREFKSRYRTWQRLFHADHTPACWEFQAGKHWDFFVVEVTNSLPFRLHVDIHGKRSRKFLLESGAEQVEPFELKDMTPGSEIFVGFQVLP